MDNYQELLIALRRISKATDLATKRIAKLTGLSTPQLLVMQQICDHGELTVGEVAREINLTQATTTSIVNGLERRALIEKRRDETDKRRVLVIPKPAGRELIRDAPKTLQDLLERRFAELADWEQSAMLGAIQRLAVLLDADAIDAAPLLDAGAIDRGASPPDARGA